MIKTFFITLFCAITLSVTACSTSTSGSSSSSERNGSVVTQTYKNLAAFEGLSVATGFDVEYTVGTRRNVTVNISEDLLKYLRVEVKDGTLYLELKGNNIKLRNKTLKAEVTGPAIKSIASSSGASIAVVSPLKTSAASISASSGASVAIQSINTPSLSVSGSSGGSVDVDDIDGQSVSATASSGGSINLTGNAKNVSFNASSGGSIDADALKAVNCSATASSGGGITCSAENLNKHTSSGGSVHNK